jgi:hypothetical protein
MRDVRAMAGIVMCVPLIVPLVFVGSCVAALAAPLVMLWAAWRWLREPHAHGKAMAIGYY